MSVFANPFSREVGQEPEQQSIIDTALNTIRTHLGMPVAYLSEFVDGRSVFRNVSAPGLKDLIDVGDSQSLEDVYCSHILEGRLPELIPDTAQEPICAALPITKAIPIGSHLSIPIRLADGTAFGMFCCLSPEPNPSLNLRDLETMRMFADLAAQQVRKEHEARKTIARIRARIESVIAEKHFSIVYQPIVDILTMKIAGFEALSRFSAEPKRSPDVWFREAAEVDLSVELELSAIAAAVQSLDRLAPGNYLSVNVSPKTILTAAFEATLRRVDLRNVVLEITEHAVIEEYDHIMRALETLRRDGLRVAVDDAGAGHSSLRHIVQLDPEFIKLDMSLTRDVDSDLARRALVSALVFYTRETGAQIIAEGIETASELDTLKLLGVSRGQGYYLGKPSAEAIKRVPRRRAG
jgi:EAL domain-containing protein (putative c-di-GMP-specific phosphodiesterase class I)